ncbi:glutaminase A [Nonomuraea wenchangensis]
MTSGRWRPLLDGALAEAATVRGGRVVSYIPALAGVDPGLLAVAMVATDGEADAAGDRDTGFPLMSAAKPFVYALALAEHGFAKVHEHVGTEPSGAAFDSTVVRGGSVTPYNAMTNIGAIVTTSLVRGGVLEFLSRCAGRHLEVDSAVLDSQRRTGDRNKALAYLAHAHGSLVGDPAEAVDRYFTQCAIRVTVADLARMAATLAGGGRLPGTGERVIEARVARTVLAVMTTCGMYQASGAWLVHAGLPAKSGVSGCLAAAFPGRLGIAAYSPPLDEHGNSVRAMAACAYLAQRLDLHLLDVPG